MGAHQNLLDLSFDPIDATNPLHFPALGLAARPNAPLPESASVLSRPKPDLPVAVQLPSVCIPPETPPLPGMHAGGSLAAILQRRLSHIAHGHTVERDMALRPEVLPRRAKEELQFALEDLTMRPAALSDVEAVKIAARHRARARHKLVKAGAYILAAIDRLDAEGETA